MKRPKTDGQAEVHALRLRVAALEHQVQAERDRVDRYADLLFRVVTHKAGVTMTAPGLYDAPPEREPALPQAVMRAIQERSEPNTPVRGQLVSRAMEMLEAGVTDKDVATKILEGEQVPEL